MNDPVDVLAARIAAASRLTILTGAGVSAASGIPTFRGAEGLWREFRPEDLATPEAFRRNPGLVWEWYAWRRGKVASCTPNPAHDVIARWSQSARSHVAVITQNVDDLHVRAGTQNLVRLHGSIWEQRCWNRCAGGREPWRDERDVLPEVPPRCPHCGGVARPNIVWFGESLSENDIAAALQATACDVFLTVGTSALVYPAAGLVHEAKARGAFTAEINPDMRRRPRPSISRFRAKPRRCSRVSIQLSATPDPVSARRSGGSTLRTGPDPSGRTHAPASPRRLPAP
jgi:NAD-dependent deacetylase